MKIGDIIKYKNDGLISDELLERYFYVTYIDNKHIWNKCVLGYDSYSMRDDKSDMTLITTIFREN